MKKLILILTLLASSVSFAKTTGQPLDQIVAVVNEEAITRSELNHSLAMIKAQIAQQNVSPPADDILKKQVLDQLINKRLQLQIASQAGITVTDSDLNQAINNIAKQNNVTPEMMYERLNEEGMSTSEYKHELRDQLTLHKLQQQEVVNRVSVSPEEITSFLRSTTWQTKANHEYHLEDVLVPLSDTPSSTELAEAKKRAQTVVSQLKEGEALQTITSGDTSNNALQGGDLGWRQLSDIPSAFAERVARMQPKEVADPIQTPNGFHVLRLAESRALTKQEPLPSRKQAEELLLQKKFEEAVQTWVSKLRGQAFIVIDPAKDHALA